MKSKMYINILFINELNIYIKTKTPSYALMLILFN